MALGKYPSTWNDLSSDGNIVETVEQENLIVPSPFMFLPSAKIQWNQDLLASEPQVTSTSPQTVVYKLKPTAKWNNGTPISADDFIYAWKTQNGHDKNIPVVGTTGYDADFERRRLGQRRDRHGDVLQDVLGLEGPVLAAFTRRGTRSRRWAVWTPTLSSRPRSRSGTLRRPRGPAGPYILSNYQSQQSATFIPNTAWYGKDKPSLKTITFKYITDQTQDVPALQNQEIQALNIQPDQDTVQQLSQTPGVNYEVSAGLSWEHLDGQQHHQVPEGPGAA